MNQLTLNLNLAEEPQKKKYRSKYTALIDLLGRQLDDKEYRKEVGIINKIIKLGYSALEIYGAWNYYLGRNQKFNSYAIFLWQKGKMVKDVLPLLKIEVLEAIKTDNNDYREYKVVVKKKKTQVDFLSSNEN